MPTCAMDSAMCDALVEGEVEDVVAAAEDLHVVDRHHIGAVLLDAQGALERHAHPALVVMGPADLTDRLGLSQDGPVTSIENAAHVDASNVTPGLPVAYVRQVADDGGDEAGADVQRLAGQERLLDRRLVRVVPGLS